jgi:histidyl-tRNA synthetase
MSRSVAEALLIKTTLTMLEEAGIRGARVHVNSVGDRDSMQRFSRELQAFLRRHIEELPAQGRELMKRDLFGAFAFLGSRHRALFDSAPKPMEFLSEASRRHLREVLEHLETADVSYEVNDDLVSCEDCYSQTLFEIHHTDARTSDDERGPLLARGGRYDELLRRLSRGPFSAVRMLLTIRAPKKKDIGTVEKIRGRKPKIYFIQLGPEARLRSLRIIEILRRAHIPLFQSLAMETLTGQLTAAESLAVPYAIIMGQKEVVENTVIVRNLSSRRQDTVPVDTLPSYIKHMGL